MSASKNIAIVAVKSFLLLHLVLYLPFFCFSQDPKNGFELLSAKKYKDAEHVFRKSLHKTKNILPAFYGLAQILSIDGYEMLNYDSAYFFATKAELIFNALERNDRENINRQYQINLPKIQALRYGIANDVFKKIEPKDVESFRKYLKIYKNEKNAQRAREIIAEFEAFKDYSDNNPINYYDNLVQKYPYNPKSKNAWIKLYNYFTADGEFLSLEQFEMYYPKFPFDSMLNADKELYRFGKINRCFEFVIDANKEKCKEYIRKSAPHHTAFIVFQNLCKRQIDLKQWIAVGDYINEFAKDFNGDNDFISFGKTIIRNDPPMYPRSLGNVVNTPKGHEYSPVISANGKHLYFCGMNRPDNIGNEDIFISELGTQGWKPPVVMDQISSKTGNEAPETVSADETKIGLYYNGDIFFSEKNMQGWTNPKPIPVINTAGWDGDAVFTADGNAMIFSSEGWTKQGVQFPQKNRKDGFDLYVSFKLRNGWSIPLNLGTTINTPWCDRYPFIHPDGKTLYFSSDGHGSLGGSDVFVSSRLNDSSWVDWSEPVNIGKYLNSTGDDNGYKISTDGNRAYFSVNKNNNIDLFESELPSQSKPGNVAIISGKILDENGKPIIVEIKVEDLIKQKEFAVFSNDPVTGEYVLLLPMGKLYGFYCNKKQYFPISEHIDLRNKNELMQLNKDITIESVKSLVETKKSIIINNVFFDTDKSILRQESEMELTRLVNVMKELPDLNVQVEGHTDSDGDPTYNFQLSQERANAVKQFLISKGIATDRIVTVGYGSTKPAFLNTKDSDKQKNRRVEIRFGKTK